MTFDEFIKAPLHTFDYKYEEYRAENVVAKHNSLTKDYDDPALAMEDYKVMKQSYKLRAEIANRYSNCRATVTDETIKDCFGRENKVLTYTEKWDDFIHNTIIETVTLR